MTDTADAVYDIAVDIDDTLVDEVDGEAIATLLSHVLAADEVEADAVVNVVIAGDELLRELNLAHRDVDAPTDVLSFAAEEGEAFPSTPGEPRYLGDIAVSLETVQRNAAEAGLTTAQEVDHVLVHGLLHLLGYDHETSEDEATMLAREESFLGAAIHAAGAEHSD